MHIRNSYTQHTHTHTCVCVCVCACVCVCVCVCVCMCVCVAHPTQQALHIVYDLDCRKQSCLNSSNPTPKTIQIMTLTAESKVASFMYMSWFRV